MYLTTGFVHLSLANALACGVDLDLTVEIHPTDVESFTMLDITRRSDQGRLLCVSVLCGKPKSNYPLTATQCDRLAAYPQQCTRSPVTAVPNLSQHTVAVRT